MMVPLDGIHERHFCFFLVVLSSAFPSQPISAQSKGAVPFNAQTRIAGAEIAEDGTVQIRFNNGRSIQVPAENGQAGREHLQVPQAAARSVVLISTPLLDPTRCRRP